MSGQFNVKLSKYINQRFQGIDKIQGIDKKPLVFVLYDSSVIPEITTIVRMIGGIDLMIDYYDENIETKQNKLITELNKIKNNYPTQEIALMVNIFTNDAFTAQNVMGSDRPNIHIMSGGSSYNGTDLTVLRAAHTNNLAAVAFIIFCALQKRTKLLIAYKQNYEYATNLKDLTVIEATKQNIPYEICTEDATGKTVNETEICFAIMTGSEMKTFISNNTINGIITGSDLTYDYDGTDTTHKIYVMLRAPNAVTSTTYSLYNELYNQSHYERVNYLSPFMYDLLSRAKTINKFDDMYTNLNMDEPPAALVSMAYSKITQSPAYGGYWFLQGHPDEDIINTRIKLSGTAPSLLRSVYPEVMIGHFSFSGNVGWSIYQNPYEKAILQDPYGTTVETTYRYMYQSNGNLNCSPPNMPIYKYNNKYYMSEYSSVYPLTSSYLEHTYYLHT